MLFISIIYSIITTNKILCYSSILSIFRWENRVEWDKWAVCGETRPTGRRLAPGAQRLENGGRGASPTRRPGRPHGRMPEAAYRVRRRGWRPSIDRRPLHGGGKSSGTVKDTKRRYEDTSAREGGAKKITIQILGAVREPIGSGKGRIR
jgi:hypothetical protein